MEGMLNDLSIGADHAKSFGERCSQLDAKSAIGSNMEFTVQVAQLYIVVELIVHNRSRAVISL